MKLLAPALLALAALTAPAQAATVEVRGDRMHYVAASGERNDLRFDSPSSQTLRVTDTGATIAAGAACHSIDAHSAECTFSGRVDGVELSAADMDDVVVSDGPPLYADGGTGDDRLEGSEGGSDTLSGGGGHDRLMGRRGQDTLSDGDDASAVDSDVLEGGGDADVVSYAPRSAAVTVDLRDPGRDGQRGEGDVLRGFERALGGAGDDRIYGTNDLNALAGGAGDDRLVGRGHADELDGGDGDDVLLGGHGYDSFRPGAGSDRVDGDTGYDSVFDPTARDHLRCGSAPRDAVWNPAARTPIPRDCEVLRYQYDFDSDTSTRLEILSHPTLLRRGSATFSMTCAFPPELDGGCAATSGTIRLRDSHGSSLGSGSIGESAQRQRSVRVRLTSAGRRAVARRRGVVAEVLLSGSGLPDASWRIRLKRG